MHNCASCGRRVRTAEPVEGGFAWVGILHKVGDAEEVVLKVPVGDTIGVAAQTIGKTSSGVF